MKKTRYWKEKIKWEYQRKAIKVMMHQHMSHDLLMNSTKMKEMEGSVNYHTGNSIGHHKFCIASFAANCWLFDWRYSDALDLIKVYTRQRTADCATCKAASAAKQISCCRRTKLSQLYTMRVVSSHTLMQYIFMYYAHVSSTNKCWTWFPYN